MTEPGQNETKEHKIHPSSERIKHLRHQINERKNDVRKIFNKSGTNPTERELINTAGEKLRHELESDYDLLTGLLERRGYEKQKTKAIQTSIEQNYPVSVASMDLDGLKETNDTLGHKAGDDYLKSAAEALRAASRKTDLLARFGGDEFQAFLVNTTPEHAEAWKKRVIEELERRGVRASIGISSVDLKNVESSIHMADEIMYEEKRRRKQQNGADNNNT